MLHQYVDLLVEVEDVEWREDVSRDKKNITRTPLLAMDPKASNIF